MDCSYTSTSAYVFLGVQNISWVVFLFSAGISITRDTERKQWGVQLTMVLFNLWLSVCQFFVYVLQMALNTLRPDPFCPDVLSYGFPSIPAFYAAAGVTFLIGFAIWRRLMLPWSRWPVLTLLFCCPLVLSWFTYNTWVEILVTMVAGVASSAAFLIVLRYVLLPRFPEMLCTAPWTWFYCIDTWLMGDRSRAREQRIRAIVNDSSR